MKQSLLALGIIATLPGAALAQASIHSTPVNFCGAQLVLESVEAVPRDLPRPQVEYIARLRNTTQRSLSFVASVQANLLNMPRGVNQVEASAGKWLMLGFQYTSAGTPPSASDIARAVRISCL
jgi:hypothetical protein